MITVRLFSRARASFAPRSLLVCAIAALTLACFAGAAFGRNSIQQPDPSAASEPQEVPKRYPDSESGLTQLFRDLVELEKSGKEATSSEHYRSLVLPNPQQWFDLTFGSDPGSWFFAQYAENSANIPVLLKNTVLANIAEHISDIQVRRFTGCNLYASAQQTPVLMLVRDKVPLYTVTFLHGDAGREVSFFAYVDGRFRYAGRPDVLKAIRERYKEGLRSSGENPVEVKPEVQEARLIHQERPVYPPEARKRHISGTVRLHAVIATDGELRELIVVEGVCPLAESAVRAVRKWRYSPTLLNVNPVQVQTYIDVIFTLGK
jgi:TonB family protein